MSSLALLPSDAVELDGARTFTTSTTLAEIFDREHYNVLRDIDGLDCSPKFRALNFEGTFRNVPGPNGAVRQERAFKIYRDGFTFLAMGYTGPKAAQFKEAYIERFNAMEAALRQPNASPPDLNKIARWTAVHTGNRWCLFEIPSDAAIMPPREWPAVIGSPEFPRELLPEVLTAVSARMKGVAPPVAEPHQAPPRTGWLGQRGKADVRAQVLSVIEARGADGMAPGNLPAHCRAFRDLSEDQKLELFNQILADRSVIEISAKPQGRGRPSRRLVAAKFVKKEG